MSLATEIAGGMRLELGITPGWDETLDGLAGRRQELRNTLNSWTIGRKNTANARVQCQHFNLKL
jgi:hypothetical protein